ncbi:MAG TPA: hypothetical protein VML75_07945 [Kofleriaceae bacterium]|nr:hypothetical protein [Kofleriaceae bacterium]
MKWREAAMMRSMWCAALVALAMVCGARPGQAEPDRVRPRHGGFGAGGFLGLTGPGAGLAGGADFYPGGRFGRYGARSEARIFRDQDDAVRGLGTLGLTYVAASARPRILISLHAEAGVALLGNTLPIAGGGVETHLWLYGPVALVTGAGVIFYFDGIDTVLGLGTTTQLRLAW